LDCRGFETPGVRSKMWRSVRTWILGVAEPRESVPKRGVACGLGLPGFRSPGRSFQNVAQRADLMFLGPRSPGRDPRNTAQLARVRIRRVSLGFRPSGSGAADPKRQRKRALFPRTEKGRTNPGRNQKEKSRACVCFVGGAGATEPFWVSQMGVGNLRVSSPPSARPNVVGRSSPRSLEGNLWFHELWEAPLRSRARGLPLPTGCSSPRSLVGNLGFHKWGCNLRVASPWAAPPNGMGRSSPQSLAGHLGIHKRGRGIPWGASPLAAPPDGVLEPVAQKGHLGFHELGEAPWRSRARWLPLPTRWGARVPGP